MSLCVFPQFVETISSKQTELDTFIAEGYKTALSEERRRYCFLVDRQCAVAKNSSAYHGKVSVTWPPRILFYHKEMIRRDVIDERIFKKWPVKSILLLSSLWKQMITYLISKRNTENNVYGLFIKNFIELICFIRTVWVGFDYIVLTVMKTSKQHQLSSYFD